MLINLYFTQIFFIFAFMEIKSRKYKGNKGLTMAIAYFGIKGYTISLPLNDTQDYDLIVEIEGELKKVQVKYTSHSQRENSYTVSLRSTGGTNGGVYKLFLETDVDFLFVVCEDLTMYCIPKDKITNRSTLNVYPLKHNFTNKNVLDTSKYLVKMEE